MTHTAIKRMSLAGAQHKLAVVLQDGTLFEPAGATPSTHILKPDHPDEDYRQSVINEWYVMRLAKSPVSVMANRCQSDRMDKSSTAQDPSTSWGVDLSRLADWLEEERTGQRRLAL